MFLTILGTSMINYGIFTWNPKNIFYQPRATREVVTLIDINNDGKFDKILINLYTLKNGKWKFVLQKVQNLEEITAKEEIEQYRKANPELNLRK